MIRWTAFTGAIVTMAAVLSTLPASAQVSGADVQAGSGESAVKKTAWKWSPVTFDTFTDRVFMTVEMHGSLLNDVEDRRPAGDSFGYDVKAGWRFKQLGVFFQFEQNMWVTSQFELGVAQGVVNLGLGLEVNYLNGYARTAVSLGPSILLFDTVVDKAGNTGFFLDVRPIGMRWPITKYFAITLDPMSFAIVAPALDRFPLIMIQFRTTLGFEFVM